MHVSFIAVAYFSEIHQVCFKGYNSLLGFSNENFLQTFSIQESSSERQIFQDNDYAWSALASLSAISCTCE